MAGAQGHGQVHHPALVLDLGFLVLQPGDLALGLGPLGGQELIQVIRRGDGFEERSFGGCMFVPLIGAAAYDETEPLRARSRWRGPTRGQRL